MKHLKRNILVLAIISIALTSFGYIQQDGPKADPAEAKAAFILLNKIRLNPEKYYSLGYSSSFPVTRTALVWNDTLARAAEQKAMDMATKKYFDHVDPKGYGMNYYINAAGYKLNPSWLKNRRANNFESIQAGAENGEDAIRDLIKDEGVPSLGHRKHLLGSGFFESQLTDIGIGFVWAQADDQYTCYVSVLIAMHDWKDK